MTMFWWSDSTMGIQRMIFQRAKQVVKYSVEPISKVPSSLLEILTIPILSGGHTWLSVAQENEDMRQNIFWYAQLKPNGFSTHVQWIGFGSLARYWSEQRLLTCWKASAVIKFCPVNFKYSEKKNVSYEEKYLLLRAREY